MTKLLQQCSGYVSISEVPLHFVDTLLCINMNRFLLIALLVPAVKISAFYHRAVTRCFNADNAYCYTSLRIRCIVLCQQYSNYTCILSNAPAIFCAYIIVRKYEPVFY